MRRAILYTLASAALAAGCQDRAETPVSGQAMDVSATSTTTGVSEGVHAPPQVAPGQDFQMSFSLRNPAASPVQFAELALAVLRPDGTHLYDAGRWTNTTVPAGGTWSGSTISAVYSTVPVGTYAAIARGRLPGGAWFNFSAAGGTNPESFAVVTGGAFAAVVGGVNVYPSSLPPGRRPYISATVRNTSTSNTQWQGHATFRIQATVQRNGVLIKQQEWSAEPFAYNETRSGFAVAPDFDNSVTGEYQVEYRILTGDGVHLLTARRESFWIEPAPVQAACTAPAGATHRMSYMSFYTPPYGFKGATPWLTVVHNGQQAGTSMVEIDFIRLWGRMGGVDQVLSANEYNDGVFGGQLAARSPWYGTPTAPMPGTISNGVLVIRPSDYPDRVWHPYLELFPRRDITLASNVRFEVRYRITGPALVQAGLDYWQYVDGRKDDPAKSRNEEAAATDWNCTTGVWQTAVIERSTEVSAGITVTTVPAGQTMRAGVPLRASFSVKNFDDDTVRLAQIGVEVRRVINGDPHCDPWVSQHVSAFGWVTTPVALAPGSTLSHSSDYALRDCHEITNPSLSASRKDRVVPFTVELITADVQLFHLLLGDLDAALVSVGVQRALHAQAGAGRGSGDQVHDDFMADQRLAPPVLGDEGEEAVLDLVPLAGARWKMSQRDLQAGFVRQALQLPFPQPQARTVAAAAVRSDEEPLGLGIDRLAHRVPPAPQRLDRELARVVVDADTHPRAVVVQVVDTVWGRLSQVRQREVMGADYLWVALGTQLSPNVLEVAD